MAYRTYDGSGNNLAHPNWGSVGAHLLRLTSVGYGDGVSSIGGSERPSARVVSNNLCRGESGPSRRGLSDFVWAWGQLLDHELDLTEGANPTEKADITAPYNDPRLPHGVISFSRSAYDPATGTDADNPREQVNQISAYFDASNVYGFNFTRARALRLLDGSGKLKTNTDHPGLLPFNDDRFHNAQPPGVDPTTFFLAGDIRANEHGVLTAMHTLFVNEHNRLCDQIKLDHPTWDDERIYQRARKLVAAIMQVITYNEFLPALLGDGAIAQYTGYKPSVNAGISNIFSTACYRLGHSMVSETINFVPQGKSSPLTLRDAFFNPQLVIDNGVEPFLEALVSQPMQEIDTLITESLRSFLFDMPASVPSTHFLDLAALNIQRGRDHGLPGYNQCRMNMGLEPIRSFAEITLDFETQSRLQAVYGHVDHIDVWVGALAEDHVAGGNVGQLIFTVLKDQFERLRDGDRYWFENDPDFTADKVTDLKKITLSQVIKDNYPSLAHLPADVFMAVDLAPARNGTSAGSHQKTSEAKPEVIR